MALVKSPLLSGRATGSLSGVITYQSWKGLPVVRSKPFPTNPKTPAQEYVRFVLSEAAISYRRDWETYTEKAAFSLAAKVFENGTSGFGYFLSVLWYVINLDLDFGPVLLFNEFEAPTYYEYSFINPLTLSFWMDFYLSLDTPRSFDLAYHRWTNLFINIFTIDKPFNRDQTVYFHLQTLSPTHAWKTGLYKRRLKHQ